MNRYKKLGKNFILMILGNFASKVMSFLLIPFYTAILTTAEYGTADLITTTIDLLIPFFTLLMSEAMLRFALEKGQDKAEVFASGIAVTCIGLLVFLVMSPIVCLFDQIGEFYWWFVIYFFVSSIQMIFAYFTRGIEKTGIYSISGMIQTASFLLANILFLSVFKMGITGYLLSSILSCGISAMYLFFSARMYQYCCWKSINKDIIHKMIKYAAPMIPNSLSWWISNSSDKYVLTFFLGVAETGIYSISQRIPSFLATVSTIFMGAWNISAVEDFGSQENCKFFSDIYRKYSMLNIIMVSAALCITKPLARFLFSDEFFRGWINVPLLLFAFLFHAMSGFLGSVYTAAKKTRMIFASTLIAAATNIALNFAFIPYLGGIGAALATFISYFLIWAIRLWDSRRIICLDIDFKRDVIGYIFLALQVTLLWIDGGWLFTIGLWLLLLAILVLFRKGLLQIAAVMMQKIRAIKPASKNT